MVLATKILLATAARRIPTIKFRKGGLLLVGANAQSAAPAGAAVSGAPPQAGQATVSSNAIEDWQLPPRYWRKPLDQSEMDYINRGGPA